MNLKFRDEVILPEVLSSALAAIQDNMEAEACVSPNTEATGKLSNSFWQLSRETSGI